MKKTILTLLAAVLLLPAAVSAKNPQIPTGIAVMSYNIRIGLAKDGTNAWEMRYPASAMMIEDQKPDVLGLQEALNYQTRYLREFSKGYKVVNEGKPSDGDMVRQSILYNTATTSVVKWGEFWLSETPEKKSRGWDAAYDRSVTWAIFKDKRSGKRFLVLNVHLDNEGSEARANSVKLLVGKMEELNPDRLPVALIGDFNMENSDAAMAPLKSVMKDARQVAVKSDSTPSYHGWGRSSETIDFIWMSGFGSCTQFETITKGYMPDRKFISDHYPVKATLFFL